MATLSHRLRTFSDGSVERWPVLWRVNHDLTLWRPNLPEVFPFFPSHYTDFGRAWQLLEKQLNPLMVNSKWHNLHLGGNQGNDATAFNNRQGFEMSGDPRVDYVNMRNIGAPNPKHEALVCGGAVLAEKFRDANYLWPEYIDGNKPAPNLKYVLDRPWLHFDAVTVDKGSGGNIVIRRFPQGDGHRVKILLLANRPIKIHLSKVTKLPYGGIIPSPYLYP